MSDPTDADLWRRRPPDESAPAGGPGEAVDSLDAALDALADEFAARVRRGDPVTAEAYAAEHPALAERIRRVFPAIAAIEGGGSCDLTVTAGERPGAAIGRYKLLERIGEGGFGVVYMAEQHHPVRRRVALKVVKPGMDSRQILTRFEAERQALAIMDHPNIAKVFDGGLTDSGRPYFVMELVKGEPITEFCDRNLLAPRARLELFAQVCHAVQHAHQKGVIHRDIKPSNVLVAVHDTTPVVKVIDFGIAKAMGHELTDRTLFTGFAQLLGTPLYMSPEQAGQSAIDVDTRSDVYSLGVLLYELLTGTTPFDKERFRQAAQDEIRRIIREEEPPRPSTRLSLSKDRLPSISAQRHTEPAKLAKLVRGELDWIVMKALEKDRSRRYETANGLAMDVQRYLRDEPVLACPPSAAYRLRKFARKHRGTLGVAAATLVVLVLLAGGVGWAARDRTARQARVAGQVESILAEVEQFEREQKWSEALAAARRAEAAVAGGDADAATASRVRERLKDHEFVGRLERVRVVRTTWVGQRVNYAAADRAYAEVFRAYGVDVDRLAVETAVGRLGSRPQLAVPVAAALDDWAAARRSAGADATDSERLVAVARGVDVDPVRDRLRAAVGRPDAGAELLRLVESLDPRSQHPVTSARLAKALQQANQPDAALRVLRDAQRAHRSDFWLSFLLAQELEGRNDYEGAIRLYTAALAVRPREVAALNNLGVVLSNQNKWDEAVVEFRKAIEIDPGFAVAYNGLGMALRNRKNVDEAIAAYRKAIELDPKFVVAHCNLGALLCDDLGEYDQAIEHFRRATELDPKNFLPHESLGIALRKQGKPEEAIAAYRNFIKTDPALPRAHARLGYLLLDLKHLDEAIAAFQTAIGLHPADVELRRGLAGALQAQGRLDEAIAAYRTAIDVDPSNANAYSDLSGALWRQGKVDEAVAAALKAVELNPTLATAHDNLGFALYHQGKVDESVVALRKAIELDPALANAHNNLGTSLEKQGKLGEAAAAYRKATELAPRALSSRYNLGMILCGQLKEYTEGVECLRKAIELAPNEAVIHLNLGIILCDDLKEYGEAERHFRRVTELDPKDPVGYHNLAVALRAQKKLDEAVAACRKAIEVDPQFVAAYWTLGSLLREQKKPEEAAVAYRKGLELDPKGVAGHVNLGVIQCDDLKDFRAAIDCFLKAIELDPGHAVARDNLAVARFNLGFALFGEGKVDEAIAGYLQAVDLKPDFAAAHYNLYVAYQGQGKTDQAIGALARVVELEPNHAVRLNELAWLLATCPDAGKRDAPRAVALASRAVKLVPEDGEYRRTLGIAHYRTGEWNAAITALERSMERGGGGDGHDWFVLAMAHWQLGKQAEARRWYDRAVKWQDEKAPKDETALRFRREASELLGVDPGGRPASSTAPAAASPQPPRE